MKSRPVRLATHLRRRRKKKEQARAAFYKDPFKLVKSLFTQEKMGSLRVERKDRVHADNQRHVDLMSLADVHPVER